MEPHLFTTGDIVKIYQYEGTRQSVVVAEKNGHIPAAIRGKKKPNSLRTWTLDQLPEIGKYFGYFKEFEESKVVTVFNQKGGVGKTGLVATLSRTLALHGLKVCVIGLDPQSSITLYLTNPVVRLKSLDEWKVPKTVKDYLSGASLSDVILHTDLPTLSIIPENHLLSDLNNELGVKSMRHKKLSPLIRELKETFNVVIFDTSPTFNSLAECALYESNLHVMPVACEIGCYSVMEHNYSSLNDWFKLIGEDPTRRILIPTMMANNRISQEIYSSYLSQYKGEILVQGLRRSIKGAEAESEGLGVIEYGPTSTLGQDYIEVNKAIYNLLLEV